VDVLVAWRTLTDSNGQAYGSPLEAMLDKLPEPPQIDLENREHTRARVEGGLRAGLNLALIPESDATEGSSVRAAGSRLTTTMHSSNHLGAKEAYDTTKETGKACLQAGADSRIKSVDGAPYHPIRGSANVEVGVVTRGSEVKDKFPVGTDWYVAYKREVGDFSRSSVHNVDLLEEGLPQVARRVQAVCAGVQGLSEPESSRLEYEITSNFRRVLEQGKGDRFSAKLESAHQWLNRGLNAGIHLDAKLGDGELAQVLDHLKQAFLSGDRDMAIKYFVAANELQCRRDRTINPLGESGERWFQRSELKAQTEDPVLPDTRTSEIAPFVDSAREFGAVDDWQRRLGDQILEMDRRVQAHAPTGPTLKERHRQAGHERSCNRVVGRSARIEQRGQFGQCLDANADTRIALQGAADRFSAFGKTRPEGGVVHGAGERSVGHLLRIGLHRADDLTAGLAAAPVLELGVAEH
jgi:hypothetical protein